MLRKKERKKQKLKTITTTTPTTKQSKKGKKNEWKRKSVSMKKNNVKLNSTYQSGLQEI